MSHKPIEAEINAAFDVWHDPHLGTMTHALTAANTLRDRRIRAEALEMAARSLATSHWYGRNEAMAVIRALKDKEPNHE